LRNVVTIMQREVAGFFGHPLAYVVLGLFVGVLSLFVLGFDDVLLAGSASMRGPFRWMAACFVFLLPAVTMRLLAEERRTGSMLILGTLPLTAGEIVVGKWLAAVVLVACALGLTLPLPVVLASLGDLDWGPVAGGYLGLLLGGAAFAAIGTATSAVTESQVVAFLLAATACLLPAIAGSALSLVPASLVPIVEYMTFEYHFSNLARGVLDTRSLVFFGAVVAVALRVAVSVLEHRRLA
jgi:ABC-2 type transport system permease protein